MKRIAMGFSILLLAVSGFAQAAEEVGHNTLQRISPVGQVNIAPTDTPDAAAKAEAPKPAAAPAAPAEQPAPATAPTATKASAGNGEAIYNKACHICHATGVAGAPKFKDNAAWAPRAKEGMTVLLEHVEKGYKSMPPKGTCADCTNEELQSAIEYMLTSADIKMPESNNTHNHSKAGKSNHNQTSED